MDINSHSRDTKTYINAGKNVDVDFRKLHACQEYRTYMIFREKHEVNSRLIHARQEYNRHKPGKMLR